MTEPSRKTWIDLISSDPKMGYSSSSPSFQLPRSPFKKTSAPTMTMGDHRKQSKISLLQIQNDAVTAAKAHMTDGKKPVSYAQRRSIHELAASSDQVYESVTKFNRISVKYLNLREIEY